MGKVGNATRQVGQRTPFRRSRIPGPYETLSPQLCPRRSYLVLERKGREDRKDADTDEGVNEVGNQRGWGQPEGGVWGWGTVSYLPPEMCPPSPHFPFTPQPWEGWGERKSEESWRK